MATLTATRAAASFPAFKAMGAGVLCAAYGSYDFATEPAAADVLEICKIPAGAVVLGGWLRTEDLDTDATETIDMDVGWLGNGVEATDADGLGNFGVQDGDAVTGYLPEGGVLLPLHGTLGNGPLTFTKETTIAVTFVDDPATLTAGTVSVCVLYVNP